ncbi:hypothetical protein [Sphingopyxis flava]|uniref:Lipoprotein n=1 Tax=Sphingopyxis flava TaxID=1507287 RepID=A0A1T5CBD1_9SPHN|nr:hypothetical protein [Sphingopyxis flava]SKB56758.1 hypothetical protein SAMN06295937_1009118 [Sphingopyxis flava]
MQKMPCSAALSLIAPLALSACAASGSASSDTPPLPDASSVALGQRAYADGPVIEPVEILEDSRCPVDVRCIWAGEVRLKMLWIRPGNRAQPFEAILGKRVPLADGTFLLEGVTPQKMVDRPIGPEDYRFSFRFDGGL